MNVNNWLYKRQEKQSVRERMADLVNFAIITANSAHLLQTAVKEQLFLFSLHTE